MKGHMRWMQVEVLGDDNAVFTRVCVCVCVRSDQDADCSEHKQGSSFSGVRGWRVILQIFAERPKRRDWHSEICMRFTRRDDIRWRWYKTSRKRYVSPTDGCSCFSFTPRQWNHLLKSSIHNCMGSRLEVTWRPTGGLEFACHSHVPSSRAWTTDSLTMLEESRGNFDLEVLSINIEHSGKA